MVTSLSTKNVHQIQDDKDPHNGDIPPPNDGVAQEVNLEALDGRKPLPLCGEGARRGERSLISYNSTC